jgi:hypothetical protein
MKALTEAQISTWCAQRRITTTRARNLIRLAHAGPVKTYRKSLPDEFRTAEWMANVLVLALTKQNFEGGLVLYRDWVFPIDVLDWMVEVLREHHSVHGRLIDTPGHLFEATEGTAAVGFTLIPILADWDAYVVPERGEYLGFICHDGWIDIIFKDEPSNQGMMAVLEEWGFNHVE